jgi:hypothetical protein
VAKIGERGSRGVRGGGIKGGEAKRGRKEASLIEGGRKEVSHWCREGGKRYLSGISLCKEEERGISLVSLWYLCVRRRKDAYLCEGGGKRYLSGSEERGISLVSRWYLSLPLSFALPPSPSFIPCL